MHLCWVSSIFQNTCKGWILIKVFSIIIDTDLQLNHFKNNVTISDRSKGSQEGLCPPPLLMWNRIFYYSCFNKYHNVNHVRDLSATAVAFKIQIKNCDYKQEWKYRKRWATRKMTPFSFIVCYRTHGTLIQMAWKLLCITQLDSQLPFSVSTLICTVALAATISPMCI